MRWILAGLTFALTVCLAIGTAAIRAENVRKRRQLEREIQAIEARGIELRRLSVQAMAAATPERLADRLHQLLREGNPALGELPWQ